MFSNLAQPSSTIPSVRFTSPAPAPKLPRGECGFLLPDTDGRGKRQRCQCRSFYPSDETIKVLCGCGHQAWHHEAEPIAAVTTEQHMTVVQELQRLKRSMANLEQRFMQECRRHTDVERTWNTLHQKQYQNMKVMKIDLDDKVEGVMDKSIESTDSVNTLQRRVDMIDDLTMDLENRLERLDPKGGRQSRSLTPVLEGSVHAKHVEDAMPDVRRELPIRSFERRAPPSTWTARVVFVPRKSQRYMPEYDSTATRRCLSRGLQQDVTFSGTDSESFAYAIETTFRQILRGRSWMPLVGYRPHDEPFGRIMLSMLPDAQLDRKIWNHSFIDAQCVAHDKLQGDLLYVALMSDDLSWMEIKWLPPQPGHDETCWQHDEELDGPQKCAFKSLDEQIMYDYSFAEPPPYSSRAQSMASRRISGLDVLANASALHPRASNAGDGASLRSFSERSMSEASMSALSIAAVSERSVPASVDSIMSEDEHRDKKVRTRDSIQSLHPSSGSGSSTAGAFYVSGRSKRKLSNNTKVKEPLHINVSGWTPMKTIRSMHGNKDKQHEGQTR